MQIAYSVFMCQDENDSENESFGLSWLILELMCGYSRLIFSPIFAKLKAI